MLFKKGVITHLEYEKGEFISPIFVRAKLDEEFCMTLNLKALKKYIYGLKPETSTYMHERYLSNMYIVMRLAKAFD